MPLFELDIDDSFNFYCPVTGEQILGPDFFDPSAATAFTFSPEAGDFESIAEPYKAVWDQIERKHGDEMPSELWARFCKQLNDDYPWLMVFGFTTHGIACGPVSNTIYVAIDFSHGGDDTEDDDESDS